jgi:hypothetical protein
LYTIRAIFVGGEKEKESGSLHHTEESDSEGELHIDMDSGPFHLPTFLFIEERYKNIFPFKLTQIHVEYSTVLS